MEQIQFDLQVRQTYTLLDGMTIYKALDLGEDCIFLDSSKKDSPYSKYSIIGANPFLTIKYHKAKIYTKKAGMSDFQLDEAIDIFHFLNQKLKQYTIKNPTALPFIAGALGYFSYDLSKELEDLPDSAEPIYDIPDAYFVFYDNYVIMDHQNENVTVSGLGVLSDSSTSVHGILEKITSMCKDCSMTDDNRDWVSNLQKEQARETVEPHFKPASPLTKSTYMDAVESMRQYIEEGHIYITNMTHTFTGDYSKNPRSTYDLLRQVNPAPFSAYMPLDGFQILSSSPERFMDIRGSKVQTRPIKGTVPRGATPEDDLKLRKQLEASEKDKSELLMIVDLERNDLSKVCIPGTVKVTELFKTEQYATVYHLVSTIEGQLEESYTPVDCLKAAFPGGSITGAPKVRAMEIIDELEPTKRHLYTGSIGYLGFDGNADFNIVIRTIVLKDGQAHIGVGGGITWESDPAGEYQETLDKAKALFGTLNLHP